MSKVFEYSVKSICGLVRANNEDNYFADGNYKKQDDSEMEHVGVACGEENIFVVCDGMGGEDAGEVASYETVIHVKENWDGDATEFSRALNRVVLAKANELGFSRMGCTISFLGQTKENKLIVGNVGDSRNYRIHDGEFFRTSKDHSKAQLLMDMGVMDAEEARNSDAWHILMQNLGLEEEEALLVPYTEEYEWEEGDQYLLCSDGLSDLVSEEDMQAVIVKDCTLKEKVDELIELALQAGGRDNATVMLIKCVEQ